MDAKRNLARMDQDGSIVGYLMRLQTAVKQEFKHQMWDRDKTEWTLKSNMSSDTLYHILNPDE